MIVRSSPFQNAIHRGFGVLLILVLACTAVACQEAETAESSSNAESVTVECDPDDGSLVLPEGFCAQVVADEIGRVRHIAVDENGDIYAALREVAEGGGIVALRDTDGDGRADVEERFGEAGGTGLELYDGYLYFGAPTEVSRYPMDADDLSPSGEPEVVVAGFPAQRSHDAKSLAFDQDGHLYINVGAPSNACQEEPRTAGSAGLDPCPQLEQHAGIWRFDADRVGQTQTEDGERYATGIRNAVAVDWNDETGGLYVVQHGRDQIHMLWRDRFTQEEGTHLPAEELFQVDEGDDFGWPYCYFDSTMDDRKELAPEYGGDGETAGRCDQFEDPIAVFPAHWAPNDLLFYDADLFPARYRNGAFIAFHGSWNRTPRQGGYQVAFVPFDGSQPAGEYETFADGFAGDGDWRPESPGNAEYRPMGLAVGPDGSLYISDSVQGRIWRVVYTGS